MQRRQLIQSAAAAAVTSLVPMAARAAGISYEELCLRILASAALDSQGAAAK